MNGVDHDDLLLRVLIGESLHRLSTRFLVDRLTVNNIVHSCLGDLVPKGLSLSRRCKSARVEATARRTGRYAPILRWSWEFEHREAEHGTSTRLSMVTAVLSAGRTKETQKSRRPFRSPGKLHAIDASVADFEQRSHAIPGRGAESVVFSSELFTGYGTPTRNCSCNSARSTRSLRSSWSAWFHGAPCRLR
jgi:hypothetical protein